MALTFQKANDPIFSSDLTLSSASGLEAESLAAALEIIGGNVEKWVVLREDTKLLVSNVR
jgi:hypothetical protein